MLTLAVITWLTLLQLAHLLRYPLHHLFRFEDLLSGWCQGPDRIRRCVDFSFL